MVQETSKTTTTTTCKQNALHLGPSANLLCDRVAQLGCEGKKGGGCHEEDKTSGDSFAKHHLVFVAVADHGNLVL